MGGLPPIKYEPPPVQVEIPEPVEPPPPAPPETHNTTQRAKELNRVLAELIWRDHSKFLRGED